MLIILAMQTLRTGPARGEEKRALLKKPRPDYPVIASRMHVEGTIIVRVTVLADGRVSEILSAAGHPLLIEAARDAVMACKFAPDSASTTEVVTVIFHKGSESQ